MRKFLLGLVVGILFSGSFVYADSVAPIQVVAVKEDQMFFYDCYPATSDMNYGIWVYLNRSDGLASYGCIGDLPVEIGDPPSRESSMLSARYENKK